MDFSRRNFLNRLAIGSAAACGDLGFLAKMRPVSAAEAEPVPDLVRLDSSIEPTVRLLEDTPRERLLEEVGARVRQGLSYRELLSALLLAGVRDVQPRPVGFKFHAVLVVNSAHLASISSPPEHRWLPIFWALDYFKEAQATNVRQGNWHMRPVTEADMPAADRAPAAFAEAMERWDERAADAAAAAMARHHTSGELYELLFRFGSRDFRDIGHKAISVSNSLRTLNCIGWHNAEPVARSLAYALLEHNGGNPSENDDPADRPGRSNRQRVAKIRGEWLDGKLDASATTRLLETLRQASAEEASETVVGLLNDGIGPQSIWDGLLCGSAELLMRKPGILTLHAVTTSNALYYAWRTSANDETRRLLLLQNAAFLPLFRQAAKVDSSELRIDSLEPATPGDDALGEIFADVDHAPLDAARKTLAYLGNHGNPRAFIDAARVLVFLKGNNAHDYKFSSAVLEDYENLSPDWRDKYLAASVYRLRGSREKDNELVQRTRAALGES